LREEAIAALQGCDLILHAGDIGTPDVLDRLARIAPVRAVRGNNDRAEWARGLPDSEIVEIGGVCAYIVHDIDDVDIDPAAAGVSAVITGHSHKPLAEMRDDVLFLNPGSAGPRRFKLPITLARLSIAAGRIEHEIVHLEG
jgi:putative phosphoesterase